MNNFIRNKNYKYFNLMLCIILFLFAMLIIFTPIIKSQFIIYTNQVEGGGSLYNFWDFLISNNLLANSTYSLTLTTFVLVAFILIFIAVKIFINFFIFDFGISILSLTTLILCTKNIELNTFYVDSPLNISNYSWSPSIAFYFLILLTILTLILGIIDLKYIHAIPVFNFCCNTKYQSKKRKIQELERQVQDLQEKINNQE